MSFRQRIWWDLPGATVRRLQEILWLLVLVLSVAVSVRVSPEQFRQSLDLTTMTPADAIAFRAHLEGLGISNGALVVTTTISTVIQSIFGVVLSAFLLLKRKGTDWFAFYIALTFVAGIGSVFPPALRDLVDGQIGWMVIGIAMTGLSITSVFLLPMLFPTGQFVPRWMALVAGFYVLGALSFIAFPGGGLTRGTGLLFEIVTDLLLLAFIFGSLIYRYRWKSTRVQRQQMKWGTAGAAVALPAFLIGDAAMRSIDGSPRGLLALLVFTVAVPVFSMAFPVCLTIAILRYRLWDIDLILSRTLVWAFMSALVVAAYVGIVFGIGAQLQGDQTTVLSLAALGLTAVLFQPVRNRVQHGIDRLLFGDRDDPYRVVRKLTDDLSETVQPVEALRATVRVLTQSLRLPYAAITLESGSVPVAMAGNPGSIEIPIPLVYQTQPAGELIVSPRSGSREFDTADRELLDDLARQIGVVAHNVRLTHDLQISRERIVTAREEERRRLRRDLHDGLGAQLAAMTLQAGALKATIHSDPDTALTQATELQQELRAAILDIRRLVQGLRPAALDDLGLIGALRARIATINLGDGSDANASPLLVSLDAPAQLGPLPAAVEVAVYRIVDEALTNVVRHANATRCRIDLSREPTGIRLTIEDDGVGIPPSRHSGVGMQSMRERATELGGRFSIEPAVPAGTRIVAELPVSGSGA